MFATIKNLPLVLGKTGVPILPCPEVFFLSQKIGIQLSIESYYHHYH